MAREAQSGQRRPREILVIQFPPLLRRLAEHVLVFVADAAVTGGGTWLTQLCGGPSGVCVDVASFGSAGPDPSRSAFGSVSSTLKAAGEGDPTQDPHFHLFYKGLCLFRVFSLCPGWGFLNFIKLDGSF